MKFLQRWHTLPSPENVSTGDSLLWKDFAALVKIRFAFPQNLKLWPYNPRPTGQGRDFVKHSEGLIIKLMLNLY